jgi:hypothetical protein
MQLLCHMNESVAPVLVLGKRAEVEITCQLLEQAFAGSSSRPQEPHLARHFRVCC